jgi:glycosyltransferase involved in cell wall biosynthesis
MNLNHHEAMNASAAGLQKLSVLMPIYNERWTVREIVRRVLAATIPLELELIIVNDCSTDGSTEILEALAQGDSRIRLIQHETNQGKGAAIRTAIAHMTGDVAVVQDGDLEYNPDEYARLLQPLLSDEADAVFGSRFLAQPGRVLPFWHGVCNKALTLFSNMLTNLSLTDMETCYKMVRADILKELCLTSRSFTFEPELTTRLAQWGARIHEVPISYVGRSYLEGKKIRASDGPKAIGEMIRCRFFARRFTRQAKYYQFKSLDRTHIRNRWILREVSPFMGDRLLEIGAGIGSLSGLLLNRELVCLTDEDALLARTLRNRFCHRVNVSIERADPLSAAGSHKLRQQQLDTILYCNQLQSQADDDAVLSRLYQTLAPGGHCIITAPANPLLYCDLDRSAGCLRRYATSELNAKLAAAGFEVVHTKQFGRLGSLYWALLGRLLGRRRTGFGHAVWSDRLCGASRLLDRVLPISGSYLVTVGRKPRVQVVRTAA